MLIQLLTPYKYYPLVRNQCIIKQNTQSSTYMHEAKILTIIKNNNIHVQHHKLSSKITHVTNYIQNGAPL